MNVSPLAVVDGSSLSRILHVSLTKYRKPSKLPCTGVSSYAKEASRIKFVNRHCEVGWFANVVAGKPLFVFVNMNVSDQGRSPKCASKGAASNERTVINACSREQSHASAIFQ